MRHLWLLWLGVLLLTPDLAHAQCTKDTDCKGERICVDGTCQWPDREAQTAAPQPASKAPRQAAPTAPPAPDPPLVEAPPDRPQRVLRKQVAANLMRGPEAVGGNLRVYTTHLAFRPHRFNIQKSDAVIKMRDIRKVEKFGVVPNGLKVTEQDSTVWEFRVEDRDKVLALIRAEAGL